jgi:hypothetical protein
MRRDAENAPDRPRMSSDGRGWFVPSKLTVSSLSS